MCCFVAYRYVQELAAMSNLEVALKGSNRTLPGRRVSSSSSDESRSAGNSDSKIGAAHSMPRNQWVLDVIGQLMSCADISDFIARPLASNYTPDGNVVSAQFTPIDDAAKVPTGDLDLIFLGNVALLQSDIPLVAVNCVEAGTLKLKLAPSANATTYNIVVHAPLKEQRTFAWSVKRVAADKGPNVETIRSKKQFPDQLKAWLKTALDIDVVDSNWESVSLRPTIAAVQDAAGPVHLSRVLYDHEHRHKDHKDNEKDEKKRAAKQEHTAQLAAARAEQEMLEQRKRDRIQSGLTVDDEEDLIEAQRAELSSKRLKQFDTRITNAIVK